MPYDSPKTLRRRQVAAENRVAGKRTRKPREITVTTDDRWSAVCDFHIAYLRDRHEAGLADSAGAHARALVTMAIERRASQIRRDHGRGYDMATWMAREQLLNTEVA